MILTERFICSYSPVDYMRSARFFYEGVNQLAEEGLNEENRREVLICFSTVRLPTHIQNTMLTLQNIRVNMVLLSFSVFFLSFFY